MNEDLYSVLGVLPDAEAVIVTAAYRALAAKYHPDRWTGDPEEAHTRMSALNAAYEVLRNPDRRAAYDQSRGPAKGATHETSDEQEQAFAEALGDMEQRWNIATSVLPDLVQLRARLAKTSHQLAFSFVSLLLETKRFGEAKAIAKAMEQKFLEHYFGTDTRIIAFARELIEFGMRDAVKELNKLVEVLGSDVDAGPVILKVMRSCDVARRKNEAADKNEAAARRHSLRDRVSILWKKLEREPYITHAKELAELLGFQVIESGGGFFRDPDFVVRRKRSSAEVARVNSGAGLVGWVRLHLKDLEPELD